MRAVFMGTPEFAADILQILLDSGCVDIAAVYTQPDRPAGRGKALKQSAVKVLAENRGLPVFQPEHFKSPAPVEALAALEPDLLLVAAYGLILPRAVLAIPRLLPINVHASLLPKYRGAAPIQRAIMEGEVVTGVTIMRMEEGLDTGPILMQQALGIGIHDTAADLHRELAEAGGELLVRALERLKEGRLASIPQDTARATHAPKLTKADGLLNFSRPVREVHAHIRAVTPWPGAYFYIHRHGTASGPLLVHCLPGNYPFEGMEPEPGGEFRNDMLSGSISGVCANALLVRCADGYYAFTALQPSGKKMMDGRAFYNGYLTGFSDIAITPLNADTPERGNGS